MPPRVRKKLRRLEGVRLSADHGRGDCSWAQARQRAGRAVAPVASRAVPLAAAAGACLARAVHARTDLPQTDVAAMDGWAVSGPPPWRIVGSVLAGEVPRALATGEAVRIATGAMMPDGADGVLRRERGCLHEETLVPAVQAAASELVPRRLVGDVRRAGGECAAGEVVLQAGARIGPAAIGLLAASGHDEVEVRRPTVDVLVLGDELLSAGPARNGRLRDALGPLLAAWLPLLGLEVLDLRRVADTEEALASAIANSSGDAIVTTGSTARGPVDHLHGVLAERGARFVVDGVAVRPGHPQVLATLPDSRPVVGLPGNPLAAVSGLFTLLEPVAMTLAGAIAGPIACGLLAQDVPAGGDATRLVPVRDGRPAVHAGPAMLRGLAEADHVAVIPPGGARAGQPVHMFPLF